MKTPIRPRLLLTILMLISFASWLPPNGHAAVTGRSADSSIAGTEKLLSDSSGTDTYILVSTLRDAMTITGGLTGTGSTAWDFSGSTATFLTSTGVNTFSGSSHLFASILRPSSNDGAALGNGTYSFSDLFLASGGVVNWANGNVIVTQSSGILTLDPGDLRITTPGTNSASVPTLGSTSTLTNKTLTAPVINGATAASGNFDFSSSSGTFKTPTGAITLGGAVAASSTITQTSNSATAFTSGPNGSTNPVFTLVNNVSSAATGIKITGRAAAAGADITVTSSGTNENLAIDAKGSGTITLNGTATGAIALNTAVTAASTITQTSNSATAFTSGPNGSTNPVFTLVNNVSSAATGIKITGRAAAAGADITVTSSGTNENLAIDAKGSGTITLNGTGTGNIVLGRAATTAYTLTQTSASATAFESGPNGGTNPVFRLVNNVSSAATGLSITGRAAAAGVDITALSSGTNETIRVNAKGSGTVLLAETSTGAVLVGDATNPAFSVVHTTEGTGVSVTSAAAASGVAVAAISSGTNESLTIDAKGSGNVTLQGTATGNTIANRLLYTEVTETVAATNVITAAESGKTFFLNDATEFVSTLPAPAAGLRYTFIVTGAPSGASYTVVTNSSANIIKGMQVSIAGDAGDSGTADDTVTFVDGQAVAGDRLEVWCDGTNWFATLFTKIAAGGTFTQASP